MKLMERRWPAKDIAEYIRLIDDPNHMINEDGTYNLSEIQARAILDLRLNRLTQIGVKEVTDELEELAASITDFLDILSSHERIMAIISDELRDVRQRFAVPRRSEIIEWDGDLEDEDLIEREDMVVTVTAEGYIKRTALVEFRSQKRGGKGLSGGSLKGRRRGHHLVRGQHACPTPILHDRRNGVQAQDVAIAAGRTHFARKGHR